MKILVTGPTGFVGSHLVGNLLSENYNLRILLRHPEKASRFSHPQLEFFYGDLRNPDSLKNIFQDIDIVFHCAAFLGKPGHWGKKKDFFQTNVEGTKNLFSQALNSKVNKIVYVSSTTVLGHNDSLVPLNEFSPYIYSKNFYSVSKIEAEKIALDFFLNSQLPLTILRPAWIIGPDKNQALFALAGALLKRKVFLIGQKEVYKQPIFIEDLISALKQAAFTKTGTGEIYNLAGQEKISLENFLQEFCQLLNCPPPQKHIPENLAYLIATVAETWNKFTSNGKPPLLNRNLVGFFTQSRLFDISKASAQLSFFPRYKVLPALQKTVAEYKKQGWL